jgi:hypothetical protein
VHQILDRPPPPVKPGSAPPRPQVTPEPPGPPPEMQRPPDEHDVAGRLTVFIDPGQVHDPRRVRPRRAALDAKGRLVRRMVVDLAARYSLRLRLITDDGKADRS